MPIRVLHYAYRDHQLDRIVHCHIEDTLCHKLHLRSDVRVRRDGQEHVRGAGDEGDRRPTVNGCGVVEGRLECVACVREPDVGWELGTGSSANAFKTKSMRGAYSSLEGVDYVRVRAPGDENRGFVPVVVQGVVDDIVHGRRPNTVLVVGTGEVGRDREGLHDNERMQMMAAQEGNAPGQPRAWWG
jgi:hypothetical protein